MFTRRQFNKTLGLTAAGVGLLGAKAFADDGKLSAELIGGSILREPAPINVGPAPLWEDFKFIVKGPFAEWRSTVGWIGKWEGKKYGDYIIVIEAGPIDDIVPEACLLLKEQADFTRHALIVDQGLPCYCTECKARAIMTMDIKRSKTRVSAYPTRQPFKNLLAVASIGGEGKGWVRDAKTRAERMLMERIKKEEGPTHGY